MLLILALPEHNEAIQFKKKQYWLDTLAKITQGIRHNQAAREVANFPILVTQVEVGQPINKNETGYPQRVFGGPFCGIFEGIGTPARAG